MRKKIFLFTVVSLLITCLASVGFAATNIKIAANIGEVHQMNVSLMKIVGSVYTPIADLTGIGMDFGTLVKGADNNFRSDAYFYVDAPVVSNHSSWSITHTRTNFANTTTPAQTLNGHTNVKFVKVDNSTNAETQLTNGYISYENSNSKIINSSDLSGARLRIYYALASGSGDASGVSVITSTKAIGAYTGTVTLTLSP